MIFGKEGHVSNGEVAPCLLSRQSGLDVGVRVEMHMVRVFFNTMWILKTESISGIFCFDNSDKGSKGRPQQIAPHKTVMRKVIRNAGRRIDITPSHTRAHELYLALH